MLVFNKHVRSLFNQRQDQGLRFIQILSGLQTYETMYLKIFVQDTLTVKVGHLLGNLMNHLQQVDVIQGRRPLQVGHQGAVLVVRADEESREIRHAVLFM